jgi:hypothetical protein
MYMAQPGMDAHEGEQSDREPVDSLIGAIRTFVKDNAPRKCFNVLDSPEILGLNKEYQAEVHFSIIT